MEAAIAIYSTAPVQLGDGVGFTNVTLAHALCSSEGRLLQPSRPMSALDSAFAAAAWGEGAGPVASNPGNLPVQSCHTSVNGTLWGHVLVIGMAGDYTLTTLDLPMDLASPSVPDLAYNGWSRLGGGSFDTPTLFSSLVLPSAPSPNDWYLRHFAPLLGKGIALLGEASKLVPVSVYRIASVELLPAGGNSLNVTVLGGEGEVVALSFAVAAVAEGPEDTFQIVTATCTIPASKSAFIIMDISGKSTCA